MVTDPTYDSGVANSHSLSSDLAWLEEVIHVRLETLKEGDDDASTIYDIEPPEHDTSYSHYSSFLHHYGLRIEERITMLLALAPHVRPELLDVFFARNESLGRGHTEFGGIHGKTHGGFLPTGETVLFVLSENDLGRRFAAERIFDRDHFFAQHNILRLETPPVGEPLYSGQLVLSDEIIDLLTTGAVRKPDFSRDFPARLLKTEMTWDELVLAPSTVEQIQELQAWIAYEEVLMNEWELRRRLRPGYTCLFYGPPGTGKTLTATLLGKRVDKDVYRIDLSTVVSKYIGETEKNLERIFDRAEHMDCILFFDEADALFGKRTTVSDAHDRYANQEVSYLLQRIEDFPGVVVLASNYKSNLDEAFMRRFQAVVHFPIPNADERLRLWKGSFSPRSVMDESMEIDEIARKYEMSGGAIMNVVRYASLMALKRQSNVIRRGDVIGGIRRELHKDGKTL